MIEKNKLLTVIILTFNEQLHIERCLKSLEGVNCNCIIIDSESTDDTVKIAKENNAIVYINKWPGNHAAQFQWALKNCKIETPWLMKLDADEYLTPELKKEINESLSELPPEITGIYLKRRMYFMSKWIKRGGYYPTWLLRIWRINAGEMEDRIMDEHILLKYGNTVNFRSDIVDENLKGLAEWSSKHIRYAINESIETLNSMQKENKNKSVRASLFGTQEQRKRFLKEIYIKFPLFLRPLTYFFWRYIIKLGFLDGKPGLIWHFLQGFWYRFLIDSIVYDLTRNTDVENIDKLKKNLIE
ncbi:glycosyltransferase family 2 protein, partial [Escherichia coli]|nr:glycosyltransferase family 2 protein [Escherichia coli]